VEFVKLHGSLTRRLLAGEPLNEDKSALLQVASELGIPIIADFVEELHALRRLKPMRIRYVQGFGVYGPQPLESFAPPSLQIA
jgi:EAL domain-containing protein (putative c-di-GMP-specific phosphodiesterase class I)